MPNSTPNAEASLRELGRRLREGFAKSHPAPDKSLDTVRGAIREQWEKEQTEREANPPSEIEPPEQERER